MTIEAISLVEAMKQALKALELMVTPRGFQAQVFCKEAYDTLRTAIEQAEKQEPVKHWCTECKGHDTHKCRFNVATPPAAPVQEHQINQLEKFKNHVLANADALGVVLDTPAAQRQSARSAWVGLTQQDIDIAFDDTQEGGGFDDFARAIEQRLKEKNT